MDEQTVASLVKLSCRSDNYSRHAAYLRKLRDLDSGAMIAGRITREIRGMHATTIEGHLECELKSLNDLARAMSERDDVMVEHYKVEASDDFDIIAEHCLNSLDSITGSYMESRARHLMNNPSVDPYPVAETLLGLLECGRETCEACISLADIAHAWGHDLPCAGRLLTTLSTVDAKVAEIRDNWPIMNNKVAEISRRNHESGNAKDAEDVFNALYTQDS